MLEYSQGLSLMRSIDPYWGIDEGGLYALALSLSAAWKAHETAGFIIPDQEEDDPLQKKPYEIIDGVAHFAIAGPLLPTLPAWAKWYGVNATAYDDIRAASLMIKMDSEVQSVKLLVNTPGGATSGAYKTVAALRDLGKEKPISVHVDSLCASCGVWLASAAKNITAEPDAFYGYMGVYTVDVDSSKAAEENGYKVVVTRHGRMKGAFTPGTPITAEQKALRQKEVDAIAALFVADVAKGRRLDDSFVDENWFDGVGRTASEAKSAGMIDAVVSYDIATADAEDEGFFPEGETIPPGETPEGEMLMDEKDKGLLTSLIEALRGLMGGAKNEETRIVEPVAPAPVAPVMAAPSATAAEIDFAKKMSGSLAPMYARQYNRVFGAGSLTEEAAALRIAGRSPEDVMNEIVDLTKKADANLIPSRQTAPAESPAAARADDEANKQDIIAKNFAAFRAWPS